VQLQDVVNSYRDATIFLAVRGDTLERGSGFFVSSSGYVLTTYHIIADEEMKIYPNLRIRGRVGAAFDPDDPTGNVIPVQVVRVDPVQDIALLKAEESSGPYNYVRGCRETKTSPGEPIYILGYDLGLGLKPSAGTLSSKDAERGYWRYDANTDIGSSGGPVFNRFGRLIGINWGGVTSAEAGADAGRGLIS
jgi:serine protease Do